MTMLVSKIPILAEMLDEYNEPGELETLQKSYDTHLAQLGLLGVRFRVDTRTKQPELDPLLRKCVGTNSPLLAGSSFTR